MSKENVEQRRHDLTVYLQQLVNHTVLRHSEDVLQVIDPQGLIKNTSLLQPDSPNEETPTAEPTPVVEEPPVKPVQWPTAKTEGKQVD